MILYTENPKNPLKSFGTDKFTDVTEYKMNTQKSIVFYFIWFIYSFIHMRIHCLGHLTPLSSSPTSSLSLPPPLPTVFLYTWYEQP
jgi:hypothetical protein